MSGTSDARAEPLRRGRVGVLMGGRSAEREVSLQSGAAVLDALQQRGWDALGIDVGADPCAQIPHGELDSAFVALHGRYGEDGCIQGFLESIGLPYTGPGVLPSALAMDKVLSKRLFASVGLPTPAWAYPASFEASLALGLPVVLKPRAEGSSVGLVIAETESELQRALERGESASLMAEQYVPGREFSVGVLGTRGAARALGTVEIRAASGFYDYEAKYQRDDTQYLVPAPVPEPLRDRLEELALHAHQLLGCTGATRVDFRWGEAAGADPLLLELNTLPGLTSHSLLPKIAAHAGLGYPDLVETILADAGLKA